ncbi:oligosaccharide repeat unit polymerase [Verrucomicrobia bacterium]|nr:oligosaccharide repeat unit polymerase [Verrucomicrobiota bacterium]
MGVIADTSFNVTLIFALILNLTLLSLPVIIIQKKEEIFYPLQLYCLWTIVFFCVRETPIYLYGLSFHAILGGLSNNSIEALSIKKAGLQVISVCALLVGYKINIFKSNYSVQFTKKNNFLIKIYILIGLSLIAFYFWVKNNNGIDNLIVMRGLAREDREYFGKGMHWAVLSQIGTLSCLMWLANDKYSYKKISFWLISILCLGVNFLCLGSRTDVLLPIVVGLFIYFYLFKKINFKLCLIIFLFSLFFIGITKQFRVDARKSKSFSKGQYEIEKTYQYIQQGYENIMNRSLEKASIFPILHHVPNNVDYLYGKSYLVIVGSVVPKAIWADKPSEVGNTASEVFYNNKSGGMPPGIIGEAYWNFGIVGVFGTFFIHGLFLKFLRLIYIHIVTKNIGPLFLIYLYTVTKFSVSGPGIYTWIQTSIILIFCTLFLHGFPNVTKKSHF